ncbi:MAG: Ig-like domain-containing protein, partial [Actinomycetota bacterium]|nr:Ig-like domain-containing protein [Actinomycetota bacterium]
SNLVTTRVDNTAPSGSVTSPASGATVGGPTVELAATGADDASGVGSVTFQFRSNAGSAFTAITTDETAAYTGVWDTTALASGNYEVRAIVSDRVGNVFTTAIVGVDVDSTPPSVTLADPGAILRSSTTLSATVEGSDATRVVFERSPADEDSWTQVGSASSAPWTATFDSSEVLDGLYDLRATAFDRFGNAARSIRRGVRFDNTAPALVSSTPRDGATLDAVSSIVLRANEPVATPVDVTLDGAPTVEPTINDTTMTFDTGNLAEGPHTLAGSLRDLGGETRRFLVHFTIYGGSGPAPYIEKNAFATTETTLTATDRLSSVTVPSGAIAGAGEDAWFVLRIDPTDAGSATNGYEAASDAIGVTLRRAYATSEVETFARPLDIVLVNTSGGLVEPATRESATDAWRRIEPVPTAGTLPAGWTDGYYVERGIVHVLTLHLSDFALLRDVEAPTPPARFAGSIDADGLTLTWEPGTDNSGRIDHVALYVDGSRYARYDLAQREAKLGGLSADDTRAFTLAESDAAGNESAQTKALRALPTLAGLTLEAARAALAERGFSIGTVTSASSRKAPKGTIVSPAGVQLAEEGTAIDVVVSTGAAQPPLSFRVSTDGTFVPGKARAIVARIKASRTARIAATLVGASGTTVRTWRLRVKAGLSRTKLAMPAGVAPGRYTIRWQASASGESA